MKGRSDGLLLEKRMGCLVDDRAKGNRREALGATARKVRFSQGSSIHRSPTRHFSAVVDSVTVVVRCSASLISSRVDDGRVHEICLHFNLPLSWSWFCKRASLFNLKVSLARETLRHVVSLARLSS